LSVDFTEWLLRRLVAMNASTSLGPIRASGRIAEVRRQVHA
jgi:hypothetical protein